MAPPPRQVLLAPAPAYVAYPAPRRVLLPLPEDRVAPTRAASAPRMAGRPAARPAAATAPASPAPEFVPTASGGGTAPNPFAAEAPAATGPECRVVNQVGYADGREVRRAERVCRGANGAWERS